MKSAILRKKFFNRPTAVVARELLGKYLVRKIRNREVALKITEVEAYDGLKDKASHASRGKTERNTPMFGPAGRFYVYFVYGIHWMLNIVTGKKGFPAAILIRSTAEISGPARLTKILRIGKSFNGKPALSKSGLWFENRGEIIHRGEIKKTPRIGVAYAGPVWSKKPYRFVLTKRKPLRRRARVKKN